MKNGITELVFILDRSGSMCGLEADTIGDFNAMLKKQKRQPGTAYVTTYLFAHDIALLHDRISLEETPELTEKDYTARGCTALLDAIGGAIEHISEIHRYARPEDVPEHTLFVITTDGMENASRRYTSGQVKAMVQERQETRGWEFLFLGANIDAVETAAGFGIRRERAASYHADSPGTQCLYETVADAVCQIRASAPLSPQWSRPLERRDQKKRGKNG